MQYEMDVKCIDKSLCEICPDLELAIDKHTIYADTYVGTLNKIYCVNFNKCTRLLQWLMRKQDINGETQNEKENNEDG